MRVYPAKGLKIEERKIVSRHTKSKPLQFTTKQLLLRSSVPVVTQASVELGLALLSLGAGRPPTHPPSRTSLIATLLA